MKKEGQEKKKEKETEKAKEKKETGITAEKDEFSEWFSQLMLKADLADYTDVSGCIVLKPAAYAIWEMIVDECDKRFKKLGIRNCYFPLLIPEKLLSMEKEHVEGFSPEVAWVTEAGNTKLSERLAIRPTSETIMYPSYSKWIRSWRDLPLKLNQWNNAVRWEFSHPVPFLRTREFLWNEGHTVYASEKDAIKERGEILNVYGEVCEDFMALYGVVGKKTEKEKFAGAVFSEKIHYIMPNGRAIEGPCFHHDGQKFSKAYDIKFLDRDGKENYAWQNTFAISTRMLGVMFAVHSDSKGLILPPKIAPTQIIIIPIYNNENKNEIIKKAKEIGEQLSDFRVEIDLKEDSVGSKFYNSELKGISARVEIGPKDIAKKQVVVVRRDTNKKYEIKTEELKKELSEILEDMQKSLFKKSEEMFKEKIERAETIDKLIKIIENKKVGIAPLCKKRECEDMVKFKTKGAKALFISEEKIKPKTQCIICKEPADDYVYAGKSY